MQTPTQLAADFDRIAAYDHADGWSHNSHYHTYLLRHAPTHIGDALDVGCGSGAFARLLASRSDRVLGIDLSPRMIDLARERSAAMPNIEYRVQDIMTLDAPPASFDCIASIATLHHLPLREVLPRLRDLLRPSGVLLILDLKARDWTGLMTLLPATIYSAYHRQRHPAFASNPEALAAWDAHGATDLYPYLGDVRRIAAEILPDARIKRHLLWRYSLIWTKP